MRNLPGSQPGDEQYHSYVKCLQKVVRDCVYQYMYVFSMV